MYHSRCACSPPHDSKSIAATRYKSLSYARMRRHILYIVAAAFGLVITTLVFYLARNMKNEGCVGCCEAQ